MKTNLNEKFIERVCTMFKLTERQLDILEMPFMALARPILAVLGLLVIAYWLITDFAIPQLVKAVQNG